MLNGGDIRFKGSFFYWIFGERISKLILGYFGIGMAVVGLIRKNNEKNYFFFFSFLISTFLYISVFARGNVQHDYYQILIIPTLCLFLGRGASFLINRKGNINKIIGLGIVFFVTFLTFMLSWFHVRDYFNINNKAMIEAGRKADIILPKDAKVIAPLDGDTTFLYHIKRQGWPAFQNSLDELTVMGADYLILQSPSTDDIELYSSKFEIVASSFSYLIVKLK